MNRRPVTLVVAVLAFACGCGVPTTGITKVGPLPSAQGPAVNNTIYFIKDGRLAPVVRPGLSGAPSMPLWQLGYGVTDKERKAGYTSTMPGVGIVAGLPDQPIDGVRPQSGSSELARALGEADTVTVVLATTLRPEKWPRVWQAQIACTAQAIPGVKEVELNVGDGRPGTKVRCADYRDLLVPPPN
ncbi:hypothetical protein AB0L06_42770 [Spirillospora sp. NPDC052269]